MNIYRAPIKFRYFFALLVFLLTVSAAFSQTPVTLPAPTGFVNDFAGVMDPGVKQQLETRLTQFKQKTSPSVELAVAIVDTTGERPIFDYSLQMAREWKIGSKADDNPSALLLVAISDRKYYTQVSRDLEDELPDGLVGQLQRQYLVPEFKQGNYSKGIADTIEAYIKTIEAKQTGGGAAPVASPTPGTARRVSNPPGGAMIGCCIFIGIIIVIIASRFGGGGRGRSARERDRWGGSQSDIAGNVMSGVAGAIIGSILSGGGSSSGSSSSSDWGGSSGGGGFGGFGGGGDFGGGGAGGDW